MAIKRILKQMSQSYISISLQLCGLQKMDHRVMQQKIL